MRRTNITTGGFQVCQVLMPPGSLSSYAEMLKINEAEEQIVHRHIHSGRVAHREFDPGQGRQKINPGRRLSELNDLILFQEVFCLKAKSAEPESLQRLLHTRRIRLFSFDPDVQVFGVAGMPVQGHGIAPHNQVAHAASV